MTKPSSSLLLWTREEEEEDEAAVCRSPQLQGTAQQQDAELPKSSSVDGYHLLWSPGAWKRVLVGTMSLFAVDFIQRTLNLQLITTVTDWMSSSSTTKGPIWSVMGSFSGNVVLPLLASSCCFLQLWINLLAGGCAGFNTLLGPVRPYFISLLIYLTAITRKSTPNWIFTSALRWSIALLPEGLHLWNRYQEGRVAVPEETLPLDATVQLEVPTMGCVACINKIDSSLKQAVPGRILSAESSLKPLGMKGGQATVRFAAQSQVEVDQIVQSLLNAVEKAGFANGHVEKVRIRNKLTS
jgi:copper chaperone CopZ